MFVLSAVINDTMFIAFNVQTLTRHGLTEVHVDVGIVLDL